MLVAVQHDLIPMRVGVQAEAEMRHGIGIEIVFGALVAVEPMVKALASSPPSTLRMKPSRTSSRTVLSIART